MIRLIPELLSHPYPIGYDTVYYAFRIKSGVIWSHWSEVFSTWLLYAIFYPFFKFVKGDPFLLLKIVAPTLYALNVCGIFYFARKVLTWDIKRALVAASFFTFLLAALRISWDLYRNTLGMAVLLFTLPFLNNLGKKRSVVLFSFFSVLVVLSHELAAVTLFTISLGVILKNLLNEKRKRGFTVFVGVFPALIIFLARIYLILFPVSFNLVTNIIRVIQPSTYPGGLFFLINYLKDFTYLDIISRVFLLFIILYLVWLPLVLMGFFRNRLLDSWTILLLIGSFSSLVTPFFALNMWNRWMFMLVYPLTFYAVRGIGKILGWQNKNSKLILRRMNGLKKMLTITFFTTILMGLFFMITPVKYGVFSISRINSHFPSTMLHNTVPLADVNGVTDSINWLNENMPSSSCVLVHQALISWIQLNLKNSHTVVSFVKEFDRALNLTLEQEFNPVYLIWWNEDIGWHDFNVPEGSFTQVFSSGRISVFKKI